MVITGEILGIPRTTLRRPSRWQRICREVGRDGRGLGGGQDRGGDWGQPYCAIGALDTCKRSMSCEKLYTQLTCDCMWCNGWVRKMGNGQYGQQ